MTKTTEKRGKGRPVEEVPQDKANEIIEWISDGKNLREYCRQEGKPSFRTVYNWLEKDKDFAARFARAREIGADAIAFDTLDIIDEEPSISVTQFGSSYDSASVTWAKNRAEMRLKLLAKWFPQKYGDRTTLAGDPNAPLVPNLTDDERAAKLQAILDAAKARSKTK